MVTPAPMTRCHRAELDNVPGTLIRRLDQLPQFFANTLPNKPTAARTPAVRTYLRGAARVARWCCSTVGATCRDNRFGKPSTNAMFPTRSTQRRNRHGGASAATARRRRGRRELPLDTTTRASKATLDMGQHDLRRRRQLRAGPRVRPRHRRARAFRWGLSTSSTSIRSAISRCWKCSTTTTMRASRIRPRLGLRPWRRRTRADELERDRDDQSGGPPLDKLFFNPNGSSLAAARSTAASAC